MIRIFDARPGKRLRAVVGHYGSGKTEFSLSLALALRASGLKTALVDLDIVNPFFRSAEQKACLTHHDVRLIAPPYAGTGVDLPVLSAEVQQIFEHPDLHAVLDVGGDDAGAAALGQYRSRFEQTPAELYYVVNPYRPYSETVEQVLTMMSRIETRSRLNITALVNNANLGAWTKPEQLLYGQTFLEGVAQRTSLPILCAVATEAVIREMPDDFPAPCFPIVRRLMPDYLL